jgi:hypothetical protein
MVVSRKFEKLGNYTYDVEFVDVKLKTSTAFTYK